MDELRILELAYYGASSTWDKARKKLHKSDSEVARRRERDAFNEMQEIFKMWSEKQELN